MSNVTLAIGGRSYTVAYAEGEENHVLGLGSLIDGKLAAMGDMTGQAETRMLLFASLLLADELHESGGAKNTSDAASAQSPGQIAPAMALRLDELATSLENLATRLEGCAETP
jgi:cell division protein ZapA